MPDGRKPTIIDIDYVRHLLVACCYSEPSAIYFNAVNKTYLQR